MSHSSKVTTPFTFWLDDVTSIAATVEAIVRPGWEGDRYLNPPEPATVQIMGVNAWGSVPAVEVLEMQAKLLKMIENDDDLRAEIETELIGEMLVGAE